MEIRKYQAKDQSNCQKICILTAPSVKNERQKNILLNLYNDYYTEQESDNCFVLDYVNNVVGYILTSSDFDLYKKVYYELYLPILKKISFFQYVLKKITFIFEGIVAKKYPAHLHIDILHEHTGKGYGTKLINSALENLKGQGVKGVFLGVACNNKGAIRFYERLGFKIKYPFFPFAYYMVKKL